MKVFLDAMLSVRFHLQALPAQRLLFSQLEHNLPCLRRTFSTSIRQCAAKKPKSVAKPAKPHHIPSKPVRGPASSSYKSFNQTLADRADPVLLYQAASHTIYMAGCYSIALFLLGWIAHSTSVIYGWEPVKVKYGMYLKIGYYGMIAITGGMAAVFIIRVLRISSFPAACRTLILTAISYHPIYPSCTNRA